MKNKIKRENTVPAAADKHESKYARSAKKITFMITTITCISMICSITASAAAQSFMTNSISVLTTVVSLIGGGVGLWGFINLLEAYGSENAGSKSQGIKQLVAGIGIIIVANTLIPLLGTLM